MNPAACGTICDTEQLIFMYIHECIYTTNAQLNGCCYINVHVLYRCIHIHICIYEYNLAPWLFGGISFGGCRTLGDVLANATTGAARQHKQLTNTLARIKKSYIGDALIGICHWNHRFRMMLNFDHGLFFGQQPGSTSYVGANVCVCAYGSNGCVLALRW